MATTLRDYPSTSLRAGSEQLTYLLFLKMADERTRAPYHQTSPVPEQYGWPSLIKKDGDALFDHYLHTLEALGGVGKRQTYFQLAGSKVSIGRSPLLRSAACPTRLRYPVSSARG